MPEGPSLVYVKNKLLPFKGKTVRKAGGYGEMPTDWLKGQKLLDISTWGKHLLLVFPKGIVRIHLLLFGRILVNERKKVNRKFYLEFADGEINAYVVNAQKLEGKPADHYDWRTDIMSEEFDAAHVRKLVKTQTGKTIGDVLMDQNIFTGVGNIIRIEALYNAGIHPFSLVEKIPAAKLSKLITEVRRYARIFYQDIIKTGKLKTFHIYRKQYAEDGSEATMKILPRTKRKIYFSEHKQHLYD